MQQTRIARACLVMACGSGKTLTCHGIAERIGARRTLVLVPSLALMSQTLREWSAQSTGHIHPIAVCSDDTVAKAAGDDADISAAELAIPVLTDARELAARIQAAGSDARPLVVFSTYHSSPAVAEAQRLLAAAGTPAPFDLAVADEAHYLAGRCPRHSAPSWTAIASQPSGECSRQRRPRLFTRGSPLERSRWICRSSA
ncbi:DEAD/DEAH box helicase family protein [Micromonospora aurantiaca (nom. illeg.)]|uniref:DEAD/DEAH box helicase family protein n=1 Tax=Micromonospora aurantiaca (nom. illeg.) TaxID=47850 RepID=UPI003DA47CE7